MKNKQASSAHVTNYALGSSSNQSKHQSQQTQSQANNSSNSRNTVKKVAITGTLAAGKSASLYIINSLGYPVLSCDSVVHDILENNHEVRDLIKQNFPQSFKDGVFSRALLSRIVFANKEKLSMLEGFIYPHLNIAIDEFFTKCEDEINEKTGNDTDTVSSNNKHNNQHHNKGRNNNNTKNHEGNISGIHNDIANIAFVEIPLLFEKEKHKELFDSVICIDAKTDIRTERFISRPHKTIDDFDRVETNQMNPITKRGLSDYCIENSGTIADLKRAILIVISRLQQLK